MHARSPDLLPPVRDLPAPQRRGYGIAWSRVEEGFYVANRDGVFLGYLDREADGTYLVFNGRSQRVGAATERLEAMRVLIDHHTDAPLEAAV